MLLPVLILFENAIKPSKQFLDIAGRRERDKLIRRIYSKSEFDRISKKEGYLQAFIEVAYVASY
jgi:hypothetical protein